MLTLVVARDRNGAIGRAGAIPWHVRSELRSFRRETLGGALIMGRRTWESLPRRPLDGRLNCVISRDKSVAERVVESVPAALDACHAAGHARLYGIGGARVFAEMLPLAHRMLLSEMDLAVEAADTWFSAFNEDDWQEISRREVAAENTGDDTAPGYTVRELLRRLSPG